MCERDIDQSPLTCASTGDWADNPGMCPDWELNQRLFAVQDDAQSMEPCQLGLHFIGLDL